MELDSTEKYIAAHKAQQLVEEQEFRDLFVSQGEAFYFSLMDDLANENYQIQRRAIQALGVVRDKRAVEPLLKMLDEALSSEEKTNINPMIIALGRIGDANAVPLIIKAFTKSKYKNINNFNVNEALVNIGHPSIPALISIIAQKEYTRRVSFILAKIEKGGMHELINLFAVADNETKTEIVQGIGDTKNEDFIDFLQSLLTNETDEGIRGSAISSLGKIRTLPAVEILYKLLKSENIKDRATTVHTLGWIKDKNAIPHLLEMLAEDKNADIAHTIANTFNSIKDTQIASILLDSLNSEKAWIKLVAARTVGELGDPSHAVDLMNVYIEEKDWRLKSAILESLGKLQNPVAIPYLIKSLDGSYSQKEAITALSKFGKSANTAIPRLIEIIQNKENWDCTYAIECLGKIGDEGISGFLIELLEDEKASPSVVTAFHSLFEANNKLDIHKIGKALSSPTLDYVRSGLVYILALTKSPEAVPYLINALKDESPHVRAHAVSAFEDIPDARAVPKLIGCLDDEGIPDWGENLSGPPIYETAISALQAIGHPDGLEAIKSHKKNNI